MSDTDVLKMKVADLKRELKLRGLATTGNKNELQERLQTALLDGDLSLEDTAIPEGLLDDEVLTDEDEKSGLDLSQEKTVLQSPPIVEKEKSIIEQIPNQQKKIVLKRKNSITIFSETNNSTSKSIEALPEKIKKLITTDDDKTDDNIEEINKDADGKKVVKLSELSHKDRLEMRAKKFGLPASSEANKLARAERFGDIEKTTNNTIKSDDPVQVEVLKKRAERFGCSVSKQMTDIEAAEKLKKREERFGGAKSSDDFAQKAKQRLERFKATVK